MDDELIMIYTTVASLEDARNIGRSLIEKRLAACANILPGISSIYRWEAKIQEASETALLIKTRESMKQEVLAVIEETHPYSIPALIVFNPSSVSAAYLAWARRETQPE